MSTGSLLLCSPLVYCRLMAVFMHCCQSPPCSFQFAHRQFGIRQWKHHSLEGDFCCCVAAGSLLLHVRWFIVEFSGNPHPQRREFASQHPPWSEEPNSTRPKPASRPPQPTRCELQPVWVWSSASVSAAISKSNVHTSFTGKFLWNDRMIPENVGFNVY